MNLCINETINQNDPYVNRNVIIDPFLFNLVSPHEISWNQCVCSVLQVNLYISNFISKACAFRFHSLEFKCITHWYSQVMVHGGSKRIEI